MPNVTYLDESRKTVTTSLESGACTFVPDLTCLPGSGHHVLFIRLSKADGTAFSIKKAPNNGEEGPEHVVFGGGGFLGFMSSDQADVGPIPDVGGQAQIGVYSDITFMSGKGGAITMGFAYGGGAAGQESNYGELMSVKSRIHSIRLDLFRGATDTRVCDIAIDGCKS